jgi:uncharacterized membrane protein YedE/YeeE
VNRTVVSAFVAGALFGLGLVISRMFDPRVVLAFLDIFGNFDPSLLFVMAGAVAVTVVAFRLVLRRSRPLLDTQFHVPARRSIDRALVLGAAIFGLGWGIAGYCPGPALVGLAGGARDALLFVPAMLLGGWLQRRLSTLSATRRAAAENP